MEEDHVHCHHNHPCSVGNVVGDLEASLMNTDAMRVAFRATARRAIRTHCTPDDCGACVKKVVTQIRTDTMMTPACEQVFDRHAERILCQHNAVNAAGDQTT